MSERESNFGFAVSHDAPIPYLQRIRDYYQALGYGAPYEWAHYSEVPFRRLDKPLSEGRVTIITTAAPYQPDKGDQGPGARYNAAAKFYTVYSGDTATDHDLRISHIATVVMGCAKDIVEHVGVPRFLFSDFPLGNAAGRPKDAVSQAFTLDLALSVLEAAPAPRTTVQNPLRWSASPDWKLDYSNIERLTPEEIKRRRAEFDKGKAQAKNVRMEAGRAILARGDRQQH